MNRSPHERRNEKEINESEYTHSPEDGNGKVTSSYDQGVFRRSKKESDKSKDKFKTE